MSAPLSIHDLHRECPACGEEAPWRGEVERKADGISATIVCPNGHGHFPVRRPDWSKFLDKHLDLAVRDPMYAKLSAALLDGTVAKLLPALSTAYNMMTRREWGRVPFFRADGLPLSELAEAAGRETGPARLAKPLDEVLVALLLGMEAFEPAPTPLDRGLEAALVATRLGSKNAARTLGAWLAPGGAGAGVRQQLLGKLEWVLGEKPSPAALDAVRALCASLRAGGAQADADAVNTALHL